MLKLTEKQKVETLIKMSWDLMVDLTRHFAVMNIHCVNSYNGTNSYRNYIKFYPR